MRVHVAGKGNPIPQIALPAPGVITDLPPQAFLLETGVPFEKADYVGLGYTNFEAWCIGAAGGRGGGYIFRPDGWAVSHPILGGAGGGGGLHHAAGLLADLPDSAEVVVGQAGLNGAEDSGHTPYAADTDTDGRIVNPVTFHPNSAWVPAEPGSDGGFSSFDGDTCRASGGKGGDPIGTTDPFATYFVGGEISGIFLGTHFIGDGGEGGKGDIVPFAGGGGAGAHVDRSVVPPKFYKAADGGWDGSVGEGGGGGVGGQEYYHLSGSSPETMTETPDPVPPDVVLARGGGKGSFSYRDTSVYGPGQPQHSETLTYQPPGYPTPVTDGFVTGGTGGGARVNKLLAYGSRAPGFNPNGAVYLRIYKVG